MYTRVDSEKNIETLGNVFEFLIDLNGFLFDEINGIDDSDLELEYSKKYNCYKVSYFNVDDREYSCYDNEVQDAISQKYNFLKNVEWERNDAYPDGTASYILTFEL